MRIYARTTCVEKLDINAACEFVSDNHRDGMPARLSDKCVAYGLFAGGLVAVAVFDAPRTRAKQRMYQYELIRLAFKVGVRVVGGAGKLISAFRRDIQPTSFFTYQDTTGDATDVYSLSEMTLVKQYNKKKYLLAPGASLETATRKEKLGMAYASKYGPNRILGISLEIAGKSNIELFLSLGWTIVETSGDRVYEWWNPNVDRHEFATVPVLRPRQKTCPIHGLTPHFGEACAKCSAEIMRMTKLTPDKTLAVHASMFAAEFDTFLNQPLTSETISYSSNKRVWWRCLVCDTYWQDTPNHRVERNTGCPTCSGRQITPGINDLSETNPELVCEWADTVDMTKYSKHSAYKAMWQCLYGHQWRTAIFDRVRHHNPCPYCTRKMVISGVNDLKSVRPDLVKFWNDKRDFASVFIDKPIVYDWVCGNGHQIRASVPAVLHHRVKCKQCQYQL